MLRYFSILASTSSTRRYTKQHSPACGGVRQGQGTVAGQGTQRHRGSGRAVGGQRRRQGGSGSCGAGRCEGARAAGGGRNGALAGRKGGRPSCACVGGGGHAWATGQCRNALPALGLVEGRQASRVWTAALLQPGRHRSVAGAVTCSCRLAACMHAMRGATRALLAACGLRPAHPWATSARGCLHPTPYRQRLAPLHPPTHHPAPEAAARKGAPPP